MQNKNNQNCFIDLQTNARKSISQLIKNAVKSIFDKELDEKESHTLIFTQLSASNSSKKKKHKKKHKNRIASTTIASYDLCLPCWKLSKSLKIPAKKIAEEIAQEINSTKFNEKKHLSIGTFVANEFDDGWINIYIKTSYFAQIIPLILNQSNSYLQSFPHNGQNAMIEFSQPNTHKAFHVGHMRNAALGDCMVQLYKYCGYNTISANYYGDEGTHVAKCLWLLQQKIHDEKLDLDNDINGTVENNGEWLGKIYMEANEKLNAAPVCVQNEVQEVLHKLESGDKTYVDLWNKTKKWSIDEFKHIYNWLNITFDHEFCESECSKQSKEIVDEYFNKGIFVESDGAKGIYLTYKDLYGKPKKKSKNKKKKKKNNKKWFSIQTLLVVLLVILAIYTVVTLTCNGSINNTFVLALILGATVCGFMLWNTFKEQNTIDQTEKKINNNCDESEFCMLVKSNGCSLYAAKDLVLAKKKFEKYNIDTSIYVVDSAQSYHFKQVFATLKKMGYKQADQCSHLSYNWVSSKHGRMSSSKGNVILFSELQKRLSQEINKKYLDKFQGEWSDEEIKLAEKAIAVGCIKYGMLNHPNNKEIVFDFDKWTLKTGNTGPYLMYQYARLKSILNSIEYPNIKESDIDYEILETENDEQKIKKILVEISQFQNKIKNICDAKAPSQLCDYLYNICKLFSQWYSNSENSIKNCQDANMKAVRLQFCSVVAETIKVGMKLLGITPLDKM